MSKPMIVDREIKMNSGDLIVSKTDTKGNLTYCNEIFIKMSGYKESELLGEQHNIVRHPDMPKAVFKLLWDRVKAKDEIFAYVKNLSKDGTYYWVFANVTPSLNNTGGIIGYYSVRIKPNDTAIKTISSIYSEMVLIEQRSGLDASLNFLNKLLEEKGVCYDEFIISLQG